ncbi:MAG: poly(R)-hydroxyalkanoic acid synthase subunit PhaE [Desulfomonilaceae bacterium]|nr:poly(R)-hydroxyalkanoic acid synthase subunit PhaE [Desulfomonilaceae bacterium]
MGISDSPDMRRDLLTQTKESWDRLSRAWSESIEGVCRDVVPGTRYNAVHGWMNPWAFQTIVTSPYASARFQEMIDAAARDLPELMMHGRNEETVKGIRDKWLRSYRSLLGEMLGIPQQSEAERVLDQWRTFFGAFSGTGSGSPKSLFPDFSSMLPWPESYREPGSGLTGVTAWNRYCERMLGPFFPFLGGDRIDLRDDRIKRAIDAQTGFLEALPGFQEQIVTAAGKGLEKVIGKILSLGPEKPSSDTYREFYRVWISTHEEAITRLFRSESFGNAVLDMIRRGIDAKKEMDNLTAAVMSPWNVPSTRDIDVVRQEVRVLSDRVEALEEEVRALKSALGRSNEALE